MFLSGIFRNNHAGRKVIKENPDDAGQRRAGRNLKKTVPILFILPLLINLTGCGEAETGFEISQTIDAEDGETSEEGGAESSVSPVSSDERGEIMVYVCGEVLSPGVYTLTEGARVYEAILMAGGLTEEADERALNQARVLTDGEQITVYAEGEAPSGGENTGETSGSLVNINTADQAGLETLSGIGEVKALSIIQYRQENGAFATTEDIMSVSGIGESLYNRIKDQITVS